MINGIYDSVTIGFFREMLSQHTIMICQILSSDFSTINQIYILLCFSPPALRQVQGAPERPRAQGGALLRGVRGAEGVVSPESEGRTCRTGTGGGRGREAAGGGRARHT